MYYEGNNELYHHGILGQRWGKRNGPPYPLDEEDHSKGEKKAGWKKSLDAGSDTKKSSYKVTRTETKNTTINAFGKKVIITARQKEAIRNYMIAGGAIVLTGVGIYAGIKITDTYRKNKFNASRDWVIPAGTTLFRVEEESSNFQAGDHFYATVNKADFNFYNGTWGRRGDDWVQKEIKATTSLKIAGIESVRGVCKKLLAEDPDFKAWFKQYLGGTLDKDLTLAMFLRCAPMGAMGKYSPEWKKVETKLFEMGYRGLVDSNDAFNIGGSADFARGKGWGGAAYAPIIFFNSQESNYQYKGFNKIHNPEKYLQKHETLQQIRNTSWSDIGQTAALATLATAGLSVVAGTITAGAEAANSARKRLAVTTPEEAIARGWSSAAIAKKFKMSESQVVNIRDDLKQDKKK